MFNKAVFFINPILELANINKRSVPGNALKVITRIDWFAAVVLSPSAGMAALAWMLQTSRSVIIYLFICQID